MTALPATGPNTEQIKYWNEISGPKWVALDALLDAQIAPLGHAAMERVGISAGQKVIDVGCGCGATSVELGRRVGSTGQVTGLDISAVMLERAEARARESGLANVRFVNVDAQTHHFDAASADVAFSRFGVMFFNDPSQAFANLRQALAPGGRVGFICWQDIGQNPWMRVPVVAAAPFVAFPPPPEEGAPGPFSFADPERVRRILTEAGFADVSIEPLVGDLLLGGSGDLERAVEFALQMGPAGQALREADEATREKVRAAVSQALDPYVTPEGVRMEYATFIVSGENPPRS